ncbi:snRNA-activating protein complex subunit 1-like [Euwallacea similis]|uniref:snRNA-activating protein complex subunit 1-like n=1 Tax=Euwallacea similis TaxID=1736056 RepID=UPI00344B00BF
MDENREEKHKTIHGFREEAFLSKFWKSLNIGLQMDVEDVLKQVDDLHSLNYIDFAKIWQAKQFTLIYANLYHVRLIKIFCEVAFNTIKKYLFSESFSYRQIGAFYLLYGMYYKQPIRKYTQIRLTLGEFENLKSTIKQMAAMGQYDAVYIYSKMRCDEVFEYVATPKPLILPIWPYTNFIQDFNIKTRPQTTSLTKFRDIFSDSTFLTLEDTCKKYDTQLTEFSKQNKGLQSFKSKFLNEMTNIYEAIYGPTLIQTAPVVEDQSTSTSNEILASRRSIRMKALQLQSSQYRGTKEVITSLDLENDN